MWPTGCLPNLRKHHRRRLMKHGVAKTARNHRCRGSRDFLRRAKRIWIDRKRCHRLIRKPIANQWVVLGLAVIRHRHRGAVTGRQQTKPYPIHHSREIGLLVPSHAMNLLWIEANRPVDAKSKVFVPA